MDANSIEYLKKTLDALAVMPQIIAAGAKVINIITDAREVLNSGHVTDAQLDEQTKRIELLRDELHRP